jgi:hypothetical protein
MVMGVSLVLFAMNPMWRLQLMPSLIILCLQRVRTSWCEMPSLPRSKLRLPPGLRWEIVIRQMYLEAGNMVSITIRRIEIYNFMGTAGRIAKLRKKTSPSPIAIGGKWRTSRTFAEIAKIHLSASATNAYVLRIAAWMAASGTANIAIHSPAPWPAF